MNYSVASVEEAPSSPVFNVAEKPVEFSGTLQLLIDSALAFGVDLEDQEKEDWLTMARSIHIIDEHLDNQGTDIMPYICAMLSGENIEGVPVGFQDKCRDYMQRQAETRRNDIIARLGQVGAMVQLNAQVTSPKELVKIKKQEADLMANLLSLPILGRYDDGQRKMFNEWLTSISRTGYLIDTFRDLREDYENNSSAVVPGVRVGLSLGWAALRQTGETLRMTPIGVMRRVASVGFKNQVLKLKPDFNNPNQQI